MHSNSDEGRLEIFPLEPCQKLKSAYIVLVFRIKTGGSVLFRSPPPSLSLSLSLFAALLTGLHRSCRFSATIEDAEFHKRKAQGGAKSAPAVIENIQFDIFERGRE